MASYTHFTTRRARVKSRASSARCEFLAGAILLGALVLGNCPSRYLLLALIISVVALGIDYVANTATNTAIHTAADAAISGNSIEQTGGLLS